MTTTAKGFGDPLDAPQALALKCLLLHGLQQRHGEDYAAVPVEASGVARKQKKDVARHIAVACYVGGTAVAFRQAVHPPSFFFLMSMLQHRFTMQTYWCWRTNSGRSRRCAYRTAAQGYTYEITSKNNNNNCLVENRSVLSRIEPHTPASTNRCSTVPRTPCHGTAHTTSDTTPNGFKQISHYLMSKDPARRPK